MGYEQVWAKSHPLNLNTFRHGRPNLTAGTESAPLTRPSKRQAGGRPDRSRSLGVICHRADSAAHHEELVDEHVRSSVAEPCGVPVNADAWGDLKMEKK
jgi:hypothetical protein